MFARGLYRGTCTDLYLWLLVGMWPHHAPVCTGDCGDVGDGMKDDQEVSTAQDISDATRNLMGKPGKPKGKHRCSEKGGKPWVATRRKD